MLAIDATFIGPVGKFQEPGGVLHILTTFIDFQLYAEEARAMSVENGFWLVVIIMDGPLFISDTLEAGVTEDRGVVLVRFRVDL